MYMKPCGTFWLRHWCALHRRQSLCAGVLVLLQLKWGIAKGGIGRGGTREGGTREGGTGEVGQGEVGQRKVGQGEVGQGEVGRWGGRWASSPTAFCAHGSS